MQRLYQCVCPKSCIHCYKIQNFPVQGFLNLNKPTGLTSHDCVDRVRRIVRLKRVGHGGTLDPAATGVLPIAIGKATRLLQFLETDKAYQATIQLGIRTTTDDLEGETIATQSAAELTLEEVRAALQQFVGTIQQIPPQFSAIQVQGKRLYDLARAGETVEVPVRTVEISKIEILDWRSGEFPQLDAAIACGPGTYIRAIARDLGAALQVGGTLAALTRTESCGFQLKDSLTLEELVQQVELGIFNPIPPAAALDHLTLVTLPATAARAWGQGKRLSVADISIESSTTPIQNFLRVHHEDGTFLGIGEISQSADEHQLIPKIVFEPV